MRVVARKRLFFVNCGKRAAKGRQTDDKRTANERQKEERKREREREREFSSLLHLEKGGCGRGASVSVLTNNQFIKVTISI